MIDAIASSGEVVNDPPELRLTLEIEQGQTRLLVEGPVAFQLTRGPDGIVRFELQPLPIAPTPQGHWEKVVEADA